MPRTSMPVHPDAEALTTAAENARLRAELADLRAQIAAAPRVPPPAPKVAAVPEAPKRDTDPYGKPFHMPREMHGVYLRDPVELQGKVFYPGSSYKTGPNGTPLTVGEVRTILSDASRSCWLYKTKDQDFGMEISLGRFTGGDE